MEIDPLTQGNDEVVSIGLKDKLFEANGNIATAMTIDKYRTMSIEDFVKDVVPKLKSGEAAGDFYYYILRDLSNNRYITLKPDCVAELHVTSIAECEPYDLLSKLNEEMINNGDRLMKRYKINSLLPVLFYAEGGGNWELAVKIPETKFQYLSDYTSNVDIYMPPVVYKVRGTGSGQFAYSSIYVLCQDSVAYDRIKLGMLCLPNVFSDCKICVGSSRMTSASSEKLSPMQVVASSWELFLGSYWNYDLLHSENFPDNLYDIELDEEDKAGIYLLEDRSRGTSRHMLGYLLAILRKPGRWDKLNWKPRDINGSYSDSTVL